MRMSFTWAGTSMLCVAAALLATRALPLAPGQDDDRPMPATPLDCTQRADPAGGSLLELRNLGGLRLPAGQPVVWSSLGTPHPQGERLKLPDPLWPGHSVTLHSRLPLLGSGCQALAPPT